MIGWWHFPVPVPARNPVRTAQVYLRKSCACGIERDSILVLRFLNYAFPFPPKIPCQRHKTGRDFWIALFRSRQKVRAYGTRRDGIFELSASVPAKKSVRTAHGGTGFLNYAFPFPPKYPCVRHTAGRDFWMTRFRSRQNSVAYSWRDFIQKFRGPPTISFYWSLKL